MSCGHSRSRRSPTHFTVVARVESPLASPPGIRYPGNSRSLDAPSGRRSPPKGTNMKVGVAGQGAFGQKHMDAIQNIPGVELITLTGGNAAATEEVAKKYKIPHFTGD